MRQKIKVLLTIIVLFCTAVLNAVHTNPVQAQIGTAYDIINTVNAIRAEQGLAPYEVDGYWMDFAQQHADYMASIEEITHTRADGSQPGDLGVSSENIGGGLNCSVDRLVYIQWADYWHTHTMIGYTSGKVGAGVAIVDNTAYYVFVVKNTGEYLTLAPTEITSGSQDGTPAPLGSDVTPEYTFEPIATEAPEESGKITHTVQLGQTLWDIATSYGVSTSTIIQLNNFIDPANPVIYAGQTLVIKGTNTPTPSPTPTMTPVPPTRTLEATLTPRPPRPSPEPSLTPTAIEKNFIDSIIPQGVNKTRRITGYSLILVCGIGLGAVLITGLRKKKE
jgi:uncharacterized protein YkwD